jgi:hypothetical protein
MVLKLLLLLMLPPLTLNLFLELMSDVPVINLLETLAATPGVMDLCLNRPALL